MSDFTNYMNILRELLIQKTIVELIVYLSYIYQFICHIYLNRVYSKPDSFERLPFVVCIQQHWSMSVTRDDSAKVTTIIFHRYDVRTILLCVIN